MSNDNTYYNGVYTIQYPSNWLVPKLISHVEGPYSVFFSQNDGQLQLNVKIMRYYENYLEEAMNKNKDEFNMEEYTVGGNKGCKLSINKNEKIINTLYYGEKKDMLIEFKFECSTDDYSIYQASMEKIVDSLEFDDFGSAKELSGDNQYTYSPKVRGNREDKWLADIEFITKELPKNHINLFYELEEEDFYNNIELIKEKIPTLTDDEIIVEVSKLIASVSDEHTQFVLKDQLRYPFRFYYFEDGIYLLSSVPEYSEYIGCKLKSINSKSVEEIISLFRPIFSYDNEARFKEMVVKQIVISQFLKGLKVINSETAEFVFIDKNGDEKNIQAVATGFKNSAMKNLNTEASQTMLYLKNTDKNYWYEFMEDKRILYFNYNSCFNMKEKSFEDFNKELFDFIDSHDINKLVVDLRNNGGGKSPILDPFFVELKKRENLDQSNKLFVIVGRETFSSAVINALTFKNNTNAIILGEPTGGKPNHFGEILYLNLSNNNIMISYSTKYITTSKEDIDSLIPDIIVQPSADDYFNGIDSVMERIL
ncbi:S41 family peptidase [Vallitalea sediminicola]